MTPPLPRRRVLSVIAGLALTSGAQARPMPLRQWCGTLLGAEAELLMLHPDAAEAEQALAATLDEIARLEDIFALLRPESEISRLNRDGVLDAPAADLVVGLSRALEMARLTGGAFDPTVQPLWTLHARHFERAPEDRAGPSDEARAAARASVGWRWVTIGEGEIRLRPGMALTLNGLAQGLITDRVAELLAGRGLRRVLVGLGEHRALGDGPRGKGWDVAVRDPGRAERLVARTALEGGMATSGPYGTTFSRDGRFHHLFDPASGGCARSWASVSVVAADACTADLWSTALAVMPEEAGLALLDAHVGGVLRGALLVGRDGRIVRRGDVDWRAA